MTGNGDRSNGSTKEPMTVDGGQFATQASRPVPAIRLDAVRSVRLHPVLAASVAAVTFAGIVGVALTRKPVYKAESLVYVEPSTAKLLSDGTEGQFDSLRYESYLQQQIQTVQRPDILESAVNSLPAGTWRMPGESVANAAARLGNALKVERQGTSFQVSIGLTGANPVATANTVNAATTAYLQKGRKDETTRTDGRVQLLTEEKDRLSTELQTDRAEQVALGNTLGVANPVGLTADSVDTELAGVRSELVAARQAHDVAAAQLASVTGPGSSASGGLAAVADENSAGDSGLNALKTTFNQRRAVLVSQMAGLTPANPVYKQDQAELADLDAQLAARSAQVEQTSAQHVRDRLRLELQRTGEVEARLNGELNRSTALASGAAPKLQRASELAADIERLQTRYASVDNALRGLQLEANGPGSVHLSVPAAPPMGPEPSRRNLLLAAALPVAILLGVLAAVFARRRAGLLYTVEDLEPSLGFAPLGTMPASHGYSDAVADESLLRLAAGLERTQRRSGAQIFVLTAASGSTDLTLFAAALERMLGQLGFSTLLRDTGSLRREWEAAPANAAEPQGQRPGLVARQGLASRQGLAARLDALKTEADFVLLDAPPLLHSAETEYFISAADMTILLIESGVTTCRELDPSMELLRKLKAGGLAAILLNAREASGVSSPFPVSPRPAVRMAQNRESDARSTDRTAPTSFVPDWASEPAAAAEPAVPATAAAEPAIAPTGVSPDFVPAVPDPAIAYQVAAPTKVHAPADSTAGTAFGDVEPLREAHTDAASPTPAESKPEAQPAVQTSAIPLAAAPLPAELASIDVPHDETASRESFVSFLEMAATMPPPPAEIVTTAPASPSTAPSVSGTRTVAESAAGEPKAIQADMPDSAVAAPAVAKAASVAPVIAEPIPAEPILARPASLALVAPEVSSAEVPVASLAEPAPAAGAATVVHSAPSVIFWEAQIRHRLPDRAFAPAVLAEPPASVVPAVAEAHPETAFGSPEVEAAPDVSTAFSRFAFPLSLAAVTPEAATPSLDTPSVQGEPVLCASDAETVSPAEPVTRRAAATVEPRLLPTPADRLRLSRDTPVPAPRRPSLPSVPFAPQPSLQPRFAGSLQSAPALVWAENRPSQNMSAEAVAERIVGLGRQASTSAAAARTAPQPSRPHVVPAREPGVAGKRQWGLLSRFGKPAEGAETFNEFDRFDSGNQHEPALRDRAAG